jgi:hypothetical protein
MIPEEPKSTGKKNAKKDLLKLEKPLYQLKRNEDGKVESIIAKLMEKKDKPQIGIIPRSHCKHQPIQCLISSTSSYPFSNNLTTNFPNRKCNLSSSSMPNSKWFKTPLLLLKTRTMRCGRKKDRWKSSRKSPAFSRVSMSFSS